MLFTNQEQQPIDNYKEITVTIGQKVKFYDSRGEINHGTIISIDAEEDSVDVVIGNLFLYTETVHADDLIEG
ncbi:MAG: hypothetical protein V7K86_05595 [Nostoc sp.]|uniref:hypothetical protein n=1 Tax=Nostoc sp. TaxID=1180 RepID=UPI002FF6F108